MNKPSYIESLAQWHDAAGEVEERHRFPICASEHRATATVLRRMEAAINEAIASIHMFKAIAPTAYIEGSVAIEDLEAALEQPTKEDV